MPANLDRFFQGLSDSQEEKVVAHCEYKRCGSEIYDGQLVTTLDQSIFCNDRCLFNHLGAVTITAGEY
ncbi:hypothetical protein HP398_29905 [Brevibacillus sp. HB1.4B]|uniref:hypothetical protein n=1 Tax=Brevibacillus sp. HB1.4B TaxID=2738845 RepID=UPI00156B2064|nr:hypothetical protein [Brevibacillus sp. HB1.4B]NRS20638.1 hypothetical protein [Brevibacillus sp. HB1.4B]